MISFWSIGYKCAFGLLCMIFLIPQYHVTEIKSNKVLAFPTAEGFGQYVTGGRGGNVYFVTNLNDHGPGSFRAAIEANGPRYILFEVSGNIELESELVITNGDLTIAGQSAPGDGICVKNYSVRINAENVIIRFLRFRMGDEYRQAEDALHIRFSKDIIIDHCSMSWSIDECVSIYHNENTTLQWCIISESLNNSFHPKGKHGFGGIWGGKNASFHHNLLAHHNSRNPRLGEVINDNFALSGLVDIRNNVIYNWGYNTCYAGEGMNVNFVGNYFKPGPASKIKNRIISIDKSLKKDFVIYNIWGKFYVEDNYIEGNNNVTENNWTYGVRNQFNEKYGTVSDAVANRIRLLKPLPISENVYTHSVRDAYSKVLRYAGASLNRDAVDLRIINDVKNTTFWHKGSKGSNLGIIDSQFDVGGWPLLKSKPKETDSSHDGMPDKWKILNKLSVNKFDAVGHELHPVYDNLEMYLNELVYHLTTNQ